MLAASIDAGKGFLVEQAGEAVALRHLLHHFHGELVVVGGDIGGGEDGGKLVLGRSNLVVLSFGVDPQFPEFLVQILHKCLYPGFDSPKIVVIQFLALWRLGAKQGPAAEHQILSLLVELFIHQEILLFRANSGVNVDGLLVAKEAEDAQRLTV